MTTTICQSQDEANEAIDVAGELELSFQMFSGDGHLSFVKENTQSSFDVSVIIKANSYGRKKQLELSDTNNLALKDTLIESFEKFESDYGQYLIVGFEYGGEILFESRHTVATENDKIAVAGGLTAAFGKAGFQVEGSAEVGYDKSEISRSVDDTKTWSIRPNVNTNTA